MKEIAKLTGGKVKYDSGILLAAAGMHAAAAAVGFIMSRAAVLGKLLPFGISYIAGCSLTYTPAAAIGVFLGYFIPAIGNGGFKYIAAVFAVVAIKLLLGGFKKLSSNPVFLGFMAFLASFLISAVTLSGLNFNFLTMLTEALFASMGAFFVCRCFNAFKNTAAGLRADELASLSVLIGMALIGINGFAFNGISIGHILGITVILTAAKYGGILSGSVSGITVSFAMCLSGVSGEIAVVYAFTGLIAGVFSSFGKYVQTAVPLVFSLAGSVMSGNPVLIAQTVIEAALGSALFLAIPRKAGIRLGKLFSAYPRLSSPDGFKRSLSMRLDIAANALCDVSGTVEQVAAELSKINSPDFSSVITAVEQDACAGCKLRLHCWESKRDETLNAVLQMTNAVKGGERSPENAAPEEFKGRCLRVSRVANAAYKRYSDYASRIAAENRIDEVRGVVSDQFDGISAMLSELSRDLQNDDRFDNSAAEKAAAALKNLDIRVEECSSKTDKYGRMTIEMRVKKDPALIINKLQVMKMVSVVCERDFDIPSVSENGGEIFIVLNEHAALRVDVGVEQKCASDSAMCGDAYKYFFDGRGHFIMILSDGMGTGGRAAVDGAMASGLMCRLIKAGFGYDCSLRILNSSMLFKSTDESLATVDIASIDLFTGKVELYKAGAAPTLVRRSGRTGKAESTSLPAGILREVSFDKAVIRCKENDIIVLMSDGAVSEGTEWIKNEIDSFSGGTAEQLSERICEGAKRRRTDGHEDDITVMTAVIKRAV